MKHRVGKKFGDTLVEVTIAIGIFSMVAVAVVAVVSGGTSGAQSNLESTVAREEMDAQAEALRFIQNAAISEIGEKSTDNNTDTAIWNAIVKHAVDPTESVLTFDNIGECGKNIYEGNTLKNQKAFIINTRKLRTGNPSEIVVPYSSSLFKTTPTYPRIIYEESKNDNSLIGQDTGDTIKSVEGLYIVAVKNAISGDSATNIVNGTEIKKRSAYYDFYIRSCWYGAGSNAPTTISTVVRLYNPDVATEGIEPHYEKMGYHDDILFRNGCPDGASCTGSQTAMQVETGSEKNLPELSNFKWKGYSFAGTWCTVAVQPDQTCTGVSYAAGSTYTVPGGYIKNNERNNGNALVLYATWKTNPTVYVNYDANATDANGAMNATSARGGTDYTVVDSNYTRSKYTFDGWCRDKTSCTNKLKVGDKIELPVDENITLYAQWKIKPSNTITFACGDGTVVNDADLDQEVYKDNPTNLRAVAKMCTAPTNHSFAKWTQSTCTTDPKEYGNKAQFTYKDKCSGVTLTAQWKSNNLTLISGLSIDNEGFTHSQSFDKSTYTKLTATGKATISYKSCHSSSMGNATGYVDLVVTYADAKGERHAHSTTHLISKTFTVDNWIDGEVSADFNETVSIPNVDKDHKDLAVEFQSNAHNIHCALESGDWRAYYHKSITNLNVILTGS